MNSVLQLNSVFDGVNRWVWALGSFCGGQVWESTPAASWVQRGSLGARRSQLVPESRKMLNCLHLAYRQGLPMVCYLVHKYQVRVRAMLIIF
jgi:hypothetical protein